MKSLPVLVNGDPDFSLILQLRSCRLRRRFARCLRRHALRLSERLSASAESGSLMVYYHPPSLDHYSLVPGAIASIYV